ncbi:MAG: serine protease, partial [Rhodococcus sp. (in: high G+C Gram-positive bacteria)]
MSEDPTRGAGAPQPQPHPYGPGGYTDPYAQAAQQPAPPPPAPGSNHPAPNHTASNRMPGRTALVVGAIALALVSGGIGGAVGAWSVRDSSGPVVNSLDAPRPETQTIAAAPEGSVQAVADRVVPSVVRIEV